MHDLEIMAVHGRRAPAEAQRQAEAGAGEAMLVVQVDKPEHAMLLAVESLALHTLLLADAGVLQLQHGRDRRAGTAQHIGAVPLAGGGVIKANFAAFHVELLFPAPRYQEMPFPRQNPVARALREIGRVERTLFMLDRLDDADIRRRTNADLNKGEARNAAPPQS